MTASVGVATVYPEHQGAGVSQEALIAAADAALYGAKRAGRNQVFTSTYPLPGPQGADEPPVAVSAATHSKVA